MKYTKYVALLIIGIIIGYFIPDCHSRQNANTQTAGQLVTIHDTLKIPAVQYKILSGTDFNIDSLVNVINQFWKDSLKNTYGHGQFETKFTKTDDHGTRNYTYTSRIPPDPASRLIVDESFIFPKRSFGLVGSLGNLYALSLKYYIHDSPKFSLCGQFGYGYTVSLKDWNYCARFELEYKFY
jgi:hypothetical protein